MIIADNVIMGRKWLPANGRCAILHEPAHSGNAVLIIMLLKTLIYYVLLQIVPGHVQQLIGFVPLYSVYVSIAADKGSH